MYCLGVEFWVLGSRAEDRGLGFRVTCSLASRAIVP